MSKKTRNFVIEVHPSILRYSKHTQTNKSKRSTLPMSTHWYSFVSLIKLITNSDHTFFSSGDSCQWKLLWLQHSNKGENWLGWGLCVHVYKKAWEHLSIISCRLESLTNFNVFWSRGGTGECRLARSGVLQFVCTSTSRFI